MVTIRIDPGSVLVSSLVVLAVLTVYGLLTEVRGVLALVLISIIFASAIEPLVTRLRRLGTSRWQGILIIYLVIVLAFTGLVVLLEQTLAREIAALAQSYPAMFSAWEGYIANIPNAELRDQIRTALSQLAPTQQLVSALLTVTLTAAQLFLGLLTALVLAYYWITERLAIRRLILSLVPTSGRETTRRVWDAIEVKIGGWVRGELMLMVWVGVMTGVGYTLLGVKFALLLAVFAALLEIVPFLGPYLGGIPALLVALSQSFWLALVVAGYILAIQLIEGYLLAPRVLGKALGLSPLAVVVGLLVGFAVDGLVGALLAVPLVGALQVVIEELLPHEPPPAAPGPPGPPRTPGAPGTAHLASSAALQPAATRSGLE